VTDPYNLQRFVDAQRGAYDDALAELRAGRKTSHWMWFVFPQVAGLGRSAMAQKYAIGGLDEARAYLRHATLGPRLREATKAMLGNADATGGASAEAVLGGIDAVKLRSSMTLFARAVQDDPDAAAPFRAVLAAFYDGAEDPATLARLSGDDDPA
jgi:uncharacterized protein (DUF1810 family)